MIKKIDISRFGLFKDYVWDSSIGGNEFFRKLNIIYGRNYSGKTTLARIFKCIENSILHPNYCDGDFTFTFYDGKVLRHDNLGTVGAVDKVRVYNTDFVKENLSWLYNDDGTIKPFTILGAKNVEIDKKIKEIERELGSEEEQNGLVFELIQQTGVYSTKKAELEVKKSELENKLRTKAQSIKNRASLFDYPTYQINTIKADIQHATAILKDEEVEEKKKLLREESKGSIRKLPERKPHLNLFLVEAEKLLSKPIKPSQPITDLINDSLLQEWVRHGIDKHRDKRSTCGFCGSQILESLWERLDAHFNQESEALREEIGLLIDQLNKAKNALDNFLELAKEDFYAGLHAKFDELSEGWLNLHKLYTQSIENLVKQLQERQDDIFNEKVLRKVVDESDEILSLLMEFNVLINGHNQKTTTLSDDQQAARVALRHSEVAQYLIDIEYSEKLKEIEAILQVVTTLTKEKDNLQKIILQRTEERRVLEAQAKDESKGAELVNQHLNHFFGHSELKLVAEGVSPNVKFKIVRDSSDARNLSEGECSLISFCYFIAKMEDEMKDEQNSKSLIIYIDDPISSLDSNHIFFMFSLIESIIAKPKKYGQLFISTHNLEFLKYLKKLTTPDKYQISPNDKKISGLAHFIIERRSSKGTYLKLAPEYLKNYITEFNYLFDHIHKCSTIGNAVIEHSYQYNFGNNMRKFLEAYLFYKYPNHNLSLDQRLDKFFESDAVTINLINRVVNEYSHLGEHFDRGLEPIDIDAISKISKAVIGKIESTDPEQYAALMESILD